MMFNNQIPQFNGWMVILILILVAWTLFWKIAGLWNAARKHKLGWFVAMSLINTVGILEIIYLFGVEKIDSDKLFK